MADRTDTVTALRETHEALKEVLMALIVVKGSLDKPYPERPEWSPWTRWVEKAFHKGAAAEEVARRTLKLVGGSHCDQCAADTDTHNHSAHVNEQKPWIAGSEWSKDTFDKVQRIDGTLRSNEGGGSVEA